MFKILKKLSWQSITQFFSLIFINSYYLPFFRSVCLPVFNCHGCPSANFGCPMGIMRNFSIMHLIPFSVIAVIGATGALIGRMSCAIICPFGYIQEWLYKIPIPKIKIPEKVEDKLAFTKYLIFAFFVVIFPYFLGDHILTICRVCPVGTLEASLPWRIILSEWTVDARFIIRNLILLSVLIFAVISFRSFCKFLCPLGAALAIFNPVSLTRLKVDKDCRNCKTCDKLCPVGIKVSENPDSLECIRCLKCTKCRHVTFGI